MKATELRFGNLFTYKNCIYSVNKISDELICAKNVNGFSPGEFPINSIAAIFLTEEWLLKLGFSKCLFNGFPDYWAIKELMGIIKYEPKTYLFKDTAGVILGSVQYVHQLQNLYFALTRKELELKP